MGLEPTTPSLGKMAFCQLNYFRSRRHLKYSKDNRLYAKLKTDSLRIPDSTSDISSVLLSIT